MSRLEVVEQFRANQQAMPPILVRAHGSEESAVRVSTGHLTVKETPARVEPLRPVSSHSSKTWRPQLYCPPQSRLNAPIVRNSGRRAVFLDRDGTVVEDVGYLTNPSQLKLQAGSVEGIRLLQDQFLIVMVTNQSAVARGLLDEEELLRIHQALATVLLSYDVFLDAIYTCLHHPVFGAPPYRVQCYCRKPQPGMLLQASDDFDIQLSSSFLIGDKGSDILAGQQAGVAATILIASRETDSASTPNATPTYAVRNVYEAAKVILDYLATSI